ncbi:GntR family transcriptional regulator [Herbiconiux moechotypicola]|uniref:GntR family transcriptional regulator n=1 Tax=Herbiconiux moechotypicola TaxID=637393 RepID=A0ABN3E3F4_9MICO|nr:GntR family transcriptional regulator [Herbiconiux moechotypicola]MCS5731395.1 GntR family transcriptional regulator [Herbiconiux moechotypicola]
MNDRASEKAYDFTKAAIIRGDYAGGATLSEGEVCTALELSRTPVHEAFLRLGAEGLLSLEGRKGAVVAPMSPRESADVLEMREAVESACAARVCAEGRGAETARSLAAALDEQASAVVSGDVERFVEADATFHQLVVAAARNAVADQVSRLLADRQQRLRHQLMRVRPDRLALSLDEHRMLAAALAADDATAYGAVLHEHVAAHGGAL